jgi:UDP-galactopyranose mutase
MLNKLLKADVIIIGAGLSGATLARQYANLGKKVVVIEKRNHIAGNCYDYYNEDGVLVSKYGAHIFHTSYEDVYKFIKTYGEWKNYHHTVKASVDGELVPVPINLETINKVHRINLDEKTVHDWLDQNSKKIDQIKNSEDACLSKFSQKLFDKIVKPYTIKQWDMEPKDLEAAVLERLPIRKDFTDGYFKDKYELLPLYSYTKYFESLLNHSNISVYTSIDFDSLNYNKTDEQIIFYTGRIDTYFNNEFGKLDYRSLKIEFETHDKEYYQEHSVINYPSLDVPFTRIIEFKHLTGQKHHKTTISKETATWDGEAYYPVPNSKNRKIYEKYQKLAEQYENQNIYFVGRLANYKYFNMDQAIKNALDLFTKLN